MRGKKFAGQTAAIRALVASCHRTAVRKGFWKSGGRASGATPSPKPCGGGGRAIQRNVGEALMLVVSELAEALEVERGGEFMYLSAMLKMAYKKNPALVRAAVAGACRSTGVDCPSQKRFAEDNFAEEMADVLIRVFDLCGGRKADLAGALAHKMRFNKTRPRLHGRKF